MPAPSAGVSIAYVTWPAIETIARTSDQDAAVFTGKPLTDSGRLAADVKRHSPARAAPGRPGRSVPSSSELQSSPLIATWSSNREFLMDLPQAEAGKAPMGGAESVDRSRTQYYARVCLRPAEAP